MNDRPIDLDGHRVNAQRRRERPNFAGWSPKLDRANEKTLRATQEELEMQLIAAPAMTWDDAAEKVRYLLSVFATTPSGEDPRRKILIKAVLNDFDRLAGETVER